MKTMRALSVFCAATCVFTASAHHPPRGVDQSRTVELEGTVIGTRWVNPHVIFWVSVGEGNDKQRWLIEAPDRDSLVADGWRQPTRGETIVLYVHPHVDSSVRYDSGDLPGWYLGAVLSDGTKLGAAPELVRTDR
jgi:hypothetical protein